MTILSDNEIRNLCTPPISVITQNGVSSFSLLTKEEVDAHNPKVMLDSGLIDTAVYKKHFIEWRPITEAELATWKPMISDYQPTLVNKRMRIVNDKERESIKSFGYISLPIPGQVFVIGGDGEIRTEEKIISYGQSSYGYDIRSGLEFKIFSNLNASIVDPKNLDAKSYQDVVVEKEGDYIIIPPNSFALAHSMECIHMPRDASAIVLGKSTYARAGLNCFTGDTKIALVDGTSISFNEMIQRQKTGERFWGYSINRIGTIVVSELTNAKQYGHKKIIRVKLDNEEIIECTPDHKFMLRDGTYCEAKDLKPETGLFPLYRVVTRGYEAVIQPKNGGYHSTHHLSDCWNINNKVYGFNENEHRHHINSNRRDNRPINICRVNASEHIRLHNLERASDPIYMASLSERLKEVHKEKSKDPAWHASFIEKCKHASYVFWNDPKHKELRERVHQRKLERAKNMSLEDKQKFADRMREYSLKEEVIAERSRRLKALWADSDFREAKIALTKEISTRHDVGAKELVAALEQEKSIRGAARILKCDRSVFRRFKDIILNYKEKWISERFTNETIINALKEKGTVSGAAKLLQIGVKKLLSYKEAVSQYYGSPVADNHKVVSVEYLDKEEDVYCLTVPEHGNFALEAGVFVHNCLATPLESEWNGHITLEFSNTTPLPMKFYAGEGCCQLLFFQGNRCDVSYLDRAGKYLGQKAEVTLPKV